MPMTLPLFQEKHICSTNPAIVEQQDAQSAACNILRLRDWKPKVRSGCMICKKRRVKCDETKPICLRCTKAKRSCCYVPLKTWLFEPTGSNKVATQFCPSRLASSKDERAFQFFLEKMAPVLATFTVEGRELWLGTIPQAGRSRTAVRHLVIAAASIQEYVGYGVQPGTNMHKELYMINSSKAIRLITQTPQPPEVVLICCVFFGLSEGFQLRTFEMLTHLFAGLRMVREMKARGERRSDIVVQIEPMLARLEAQIMTFRPWNAANPMFDLEWSRPVIPGVFHGLFEARDSLYDVMRFVLQQRSASNSDDVRIVMNEWDGALSTFQEDLEDDSGEYRTVQILRVHQRFLTILLETSPRDIWDAYEPNFPPLLDSLESTGFESLEYDFGFIPPLFNIAIRSRVSATQSRAIAMLKTLHRREGVWDTCLAAKIASVLLELEQNRPQESYQRLHLHNVNLIDHKITLAFSQCPHLLTEYTDFSWPAASLIVWPLQPILQNATYQGIVRTIGGLCSCGKLSPAAAIVPNFSAFERQCAAAGLPLLEPKVLETQKTTLHAFRARDLTHHLNPR